MRRQSRLFYVKYRNIDLFADAAHGLRNGPETRRIVTAKVDRYSGGVEVSDLAPDPSIKTPTSMNL